MKIIHIKQRHKLPFDIKPDPEVMESTVQSQFMVAQEIKKHPGCPIVAEGFSDDVSDAASHPFSEVARYLFPQGFPTNFNDLTPLQKDFLYDQGAPWVLFFLGEIPSIYKSIHKEADIIFTQGIKEGFKAEKTYPSRDLEAIACSKEAAIKHFHKFDGTTVILIYGHGHDLKPYCEKEGIEYKIINALIDPHLGSLPTNSSLTAAYAESRKKHEQHDRSTLKKRLEDNKIEATTTPISSNLPISTPPKPNSSAIKTPPPFTTSIQSKPVSKKQKFQPILMQRILSTGLVMAGMSGMGGMATEESTTSRSTITFFKPTTSQIVNPLEFTIDPGLEEALNNGNIRRNYIEPGMTTLENIIQLYKKAPWAMSALRCSNIHQAIIHKHITIDDLESLNEEQSKSIEHKYEGKHLASKINEFIAQNKVSNSL